MNKRGAGVAFCSISSFLFSVNYFGKYFARAEDAYHFNSILGFGTISLIVGIIYIISEEASEIRRLGQKIGEWSRR